MVMTSVQLVAAADGDLACLNLELARLAIFSLAAVMEALLAARLAAFLVSLLESLAQDMMAVLAASSNFLHFPKAVVHFFRAAVMAEDYLLALQSLRVAAVMLSISPVQQEQASLVLVLPPPTDLPRQTVASLVKLSTSSLQWLMKVKFG